MGEVEMSKPEHCNGCISWVSAGRVKPDKNLRKYNSWCCAMGKEASKAVGHCKTRDLKKTKAF